MRHKPVELPKVNCTSPSCFKSTNRPKICLTLIGGQPLFFCCAKCFTYWLQNEGGLEEVNYAS